MDKKNDIISSVMKVFTHKHEFEKEGIYNKLKCKCGKNIMVKE